MPQGSRDFSVRAEPVSLPSQASDMLAVRTRQLTAEDFHLIRLAALSAAPGASTLMETELQDVRLCGLPENQGSLSTNGSHAPFHRIHMDFTKAVAIFISGIFSPSMVHALMVVSPDA